jgi:peptidyl-prolyl cis-trans isomerase B (cyclophilin B)
VEGRTFTDAQLDSIEVARLQGRRLLPERRDYYKTIGGTPQLDGNYTVFGEVVRGLEVVDKIAGVETSKGRDRPLQDVRILMVRLVKRRR